MASLLSTQLAMMALNVEQKLVSSVALVYAPGAASVNPMGYTSINRLMSDANSELGLHRLTVDGGPGSQFRPYQAILKSALESANNNRTFVQPGPSPVSFP